MLSTACQWKYDSDGGSALGQVLECAQSSSLSPYPICEHVKVECCCSSNTCTAVISGQAEDHVSQGTMLQGLDTAMKAHAIVELNPSLCRRQL